MAKIPASREEYAIDDTPRPRYADAAIHNVIADCIIFSHIGLPACQLLLHEAALKMIYSVEAVTAALADYVIVSLIPLHYYAASAGIATPLLILMIIAMLILH